MAFEWNAAQYKSSSGMQATYGHELLDSISVSESACVLDAGCGVGNLTLELAARAVKGHVTGIDSSDAMIDKCMKAVGESGFANVEFLKMDLTALPFENRFDIIFSNSVLHWVKPIEEALAGFRKALRPTGCLAVQFPLLNAKHPLVSLADETIGALELREFYKEWEFPWYVPTVESFRAQLQKAGFGRTQVIQKESTFTFNSDSEAYAFFDLIGLKLYRDQLPPDTAGLFNEVFKQRIQALAGSKSVEFQIERLFAFANGTPDT